MAKFVDDNGLLYVWQKIVALFRSKSDEIGMSDLTTELQNKINAAGASDFDGDYESLDNIPTFNGTVWKGTLTDSEVGIGLKSELTAHNTSGTAHTDIRNLISGLDFRITGLENLGHFVGAFDTFAEIPENVSAFSAAPSVNDFVIIRKDESFDDKPTIYMILSIDGSGDITWEHIITLEDDITGKVDIDQGVGNAGKYLLVDSLGMVSLGVLEALTNVEIQGIIDTVMGV